MELTYLLRVKGINEVTESILMMEAFDIVDEVFDACVHKLFWNVVRKRHIVCLNDDGRIRGMRTFIGISDKGKIVRRL